METMIIDTVQHFRIEYAAEKTGYTVTELLAMHKIKSIPGKFLAGKLWFSQDHIDEIKARRQNKVKITTTGISLSEAAEITGYKPSTLKEYVKQGKIKGNDTNGSLWFTKAQVADIRKYKAAQNPLAPKRLQVKRPKDPELQKEYICAVKLAKAMGIPVTDFLLSSARPVIKAKGGLLKELLK